MTVYVHVYVYVYVYACVCIYIYIHTHTDWARGLFVRRDESPRPDSKSERVLPDRCKAKLRNLPEKTAETFLPACQALDGRRAVRTGDPQPQFGRLVKAAECRPV